MTCARSATLSAFLLEAHAARGAVHTNERSARRSCRAAGHDETCTARQRADDLSEAGAVVLGPLLVVRSWVLSRHAPRRRDTAAPDRGSFPSQVLRHHRRITPRMTSKMIAPRVATTIVLMNGSLMGMETPRRENK